ncbi:respiratory nitrate reductase subunit gamma [Ammonifex thiophilus]|uniref:Nitrate reductase n=1 Tax=Ammonifex thiophilus TaxID=444093 RepID=A0A3D8P5F9_9THEO|nr:respiratory nitrate reductase subunit gamma [Ammonifex thiophilus]RDV84556.1 nitrate reductase [Ammonifex thiophilus]
MKYFLVQILPYFTVALFLGGIVWRIWRWMIARIVHNITLSPFPSNWVAAILWILWQMVFFWNVLKFDPWLWVGAWPMHVALFSILGGHVLGIYTLGTQFHLLFPWLITEAQSEHASEFLGTFFGIIFFVALVYLLVRRLTLTRMKVLSSTSDYLHLLLLLAISGVGNYMRLVEGAGVTYAEARTFLAGLFTFNPQPFPDNWFFFTHFLLVQLLMIVFPFSKLMHSFGIMWERWIVNRPYKEAPLGLPGVKLRLD